MVFCVPEVNDRAQHTDESSGVQRPAGVSQVFIRGGNYIASDMLLRTSRQRYQDEVRMHAEVLTRFCSQSGHHYFSTDEVLRHVYNWNSCMISFGGAESPMTRLLSIQAIMPHFCFFQPSSQAVHM